MNDGSARVPKLIRRSAVFYQGHRLARGVEGALE